MVFVFLTPVCLFLCLGSDLSVPEMIGSTRVRGARATGSGPALCGLKQTGQGVGLGLGFGWGQSLVVCVGGAAAADGWLHTHRPGP